jgi:hypothetical protein
MAFANPNSFEYSWTQMRLLFVRYLPGLTLLTAAVFLNYLYRYRGSFRWILLKNKFQFNYRSFSKGFISGSPDPYLWVTIIFFLFLLLKLGGNAGTFMTYHFQLLVFSWIIFAIIEGSKFKGLPVIQVSTLAFAVYTATTLITSTGFFKPENIAGWDKAKQLIRKHEKILNDQTLATEMIYAGRQLYNSGLTDYYFRSTINDQFNRMFPFTAKIMERGDAFKQLVRDNIQNQQFEVLMLAQPNWIVHKIPVDQYYMITDSLRLNMYYTGQDWTIYIWKPKNDSLNVVANQTSSFH